MKYFAKFLITGCVSFTLITIWYTASAAIGFTDPVDSTVIWQLLIINFAISLLMCFTDQIPFRSQLPNTLVSIADIFVCVFLIGGVAMKMFTFRPVIVVVLSVLIVCVYFLVFGILYWKNRTDTERINRKLRERRKRNEANDH